VPQTGFAEDGTPFVGHNLATHIKSLEEQMRAAASDLEFEEAARLRDEIKRLQETELALLDDPFARQEAIRQRTGTDAPKGSKAAAKAAGKGKRRRRGS